MSVLFASPCQLCPRKCGVLRHQRHGGYCGGGVQFKVARAAPHFWEEPCISGVNGTGAVFFCGCTLGCVFCQNRDISHNAAQGYDVTITRLGEILLELQTKGVHNISLITASHYAPLCVESIALARKLGLALPVVWNSSGYESIATVQMLKDTVDVYLPDMKFWSPTVSKRYANAPDYGLTALGAITAMVEQVGPPIFDEHGLLQKGVLVRHLALPGLEVDSLAVMDVLNRRFRDEILFSLMNQYTPLYQDDDYPELALPLLPAAYARLVAHAEKMHFYHIYTQLDGTVGEDFIPPFDGEGVI